VAAVLIMGCGLVSVASWPADGWAQSAPDEGDGAVALPDIEYVYEGVDIRGNAKTANFFFRSLLDLEPGERVHLDQLDRFRRRLISTGFFSAVDARLTEGRSPESVVVQVDVEERNTIRLDNIYMGWSRETPFWGGIDLSEANFLGTGITLGGGFVLSGDQQGGNLFVAEPFATLLPLHWHVEGFLANAVDEGPSFDQQGRLVEEPFEWRRIGGRLALGVEPWSSVAFGLSARLESLDFAHLDLLSPHPRTGFLVGDSLLSIVGVSASVDLRNHPILPTTGFGVHVAVEGSGEASGSDYSFVRLLAGADLDLSLATDHVLRLELDGGLLWFPETAPYAEGFYVGDLTPWVPTSKHGLRVSDRRSLDLFSNGADLVTYGDVFSRFQAEWAIRIGEPRPSLRRFELVFGSGLLLVRQGPWDIGRAAPFISDDPTEDADSVRPDLYFDVGLQADTAIGLFGLSLGSALSLAPLN
jgi:hypothetical protein